MSSALSQDDVARLLAEPSAALRLQLAGKLAQEIDSPQLNPAELKLIKDIVVIMAKDVETAVRQSLAQHLCKTQNMPCEVALALAKDVENVALPILRHSDVLTDAELVGLIDVGSMAKLNAIASRAAVSETVSAALIAVAPETTVAMLMDNAGARISEHSLGQAIDRFADSALVKEKMVRRQVLQMAVAERLALIVAENLRDHLVRHHELSSDVATNLVLQSRERATINFSRYSSEAELEEMVAQMHRGGRLTPSLLLRTLCMGDIAFFETVLAVMADVPLVNARLLIHDKGVLGFKSLYGKTGLPAELLPAISTALAVVQESAMDGGDYDRERYQTRVMERILTQCEGQGGTDFDYLLARLDGKAAGSTQAHNG